MSDHPQPTLGDLYRTSELGLMISRAIADHADEIRHAAEAGEPPLAVIGARLYEHIHENIYWRLAERMIGELLGPEFKAAGRKEVPISSYRRGRVYVRNSQTD